MNRSEQAAAYALGELSGAEGAAFEARLAEDAELRREVDALRATMASLGELPAEAWPAGEGADGARAGEVVASDRFVDERSEAPRRREPEPSRGSELVAPRPRRRVWSLRPAFAIGLLVLAIAVGGAAGALIFSGGGSETPAPTLIQLNRLDAPAKAGADISMPAAETMLLNVHGLPPSAAGNYYEVWLMNDAESLVPVASFRVGRTGQARIEVPLPASPAGYRYFDVSRQTLAGGTGHSSDSVLRGPT